MQQLTFTNTLIFGMSIISALAIVFFPDLYAFGMHRYNYDIWLYHLWIIQFFSSQLLHWGAVHLFMNMVFIGYFWNAIERLLGYHKMFLFFTLNAIFLWVVLTFASWGVSVWASGFAMAVLAYYTLQLYSIRHPDYRWWITALSLNILIWFYPGISLIGHLWGAVFWAIFWYGHTWLKKYI